MIERPILFSGSMVEALLAGTKSQTRRVYKPRHPEPYEYVQDGVPYRDYDGEVSAVLCPHGQHGDRLWVREKWAHEDSWYGKETASFKNCYVPDRGYTWITYAADIVSPAEVPDRWRPSIFMPRWASRLTLEVRSVRVERLQEISEADARAEGTADRAAYAHLWDKINAKRAPWASDPWVWVVEFRRLS